MIGHQLFDRAWQQHNTERNEAIPRDNSEESGTIIHLSCYHLQLSTHTKSVLTDDRHDRYELLPLWPTRFA